ncbi:MAG: phage tail tape measure protein [Thauera sp.]|nr:phage tail tape measure protein [Thauera sp.]
MGEVGDGHCSTGVGSLEAAHVELIHTGTAGQGALHHGLLEKGYAPGTCNLVLLLLKTVFNTAIRWELLPAGSNPCDGVKELDDNGARERYLTPQEVQRLFAELDTNRNVQVAAATGTSIETAAAMVGKLGDAGIQGSQAGTALRAVLNRIAAPAAKAQSLFEELGVSTRDAVLRYGVPLVQRNSDGHVEVHGQAWGHGGIDQAWYVRAVITAHDAGADASGEDVADALAQVLDAGQRLAREGVDAVHGWPP